MTALKELGMLRIYTKPRGKAVDLTDPLVVRHDATIEDVVRARPEPHSDDLCRAV